MSDADPGTEVVAGAADAPAEPPEPPAWLQRARERVAAFRALGVEVPAVTERLAQAEAADAAGDAEAAEDLCDEIAVLTALVTREVQRAVGAKLPPEAATPVAEVDGAAEAAESLVPPEAVLQAAVATAVRAAVLDAEDRWRSALLAEVETRVGDKLADARERWAAAVLERALAELDEKIAAFPAPPPASPAAASAGPPPDVVTMNDLRKEIAKALELHEPASPPPPPPPPPPEKVGELAISEESVLALANTAAFKELLEDRFSVMLRYIRDDVIPKAVKRATGESPKPKAKDAAQPKPKPTAKATTPKHKPKTQAPAPKPKKKR